MVRLPKPSQQRDKAAGAAVPSVAGVGTGGSFLWTLMLCGLFSTMFNVLYEAAVALGPVHSDIEGHDGKAASLDRRVHTVEAMNKPKVVHLERQQKENGNEDDEEQKRKWWKEKLTHGRPKEAQSLKWQMENDKKEKGTEKEEEPEMVDWDNLDPEFVKDKGPLLDLVRDAGITNVDFETLKTLPSWSDVTDLYGEKPILYGHPDQCEKFQNLPNKSLHFVSVAGNFNTGTNLMSEMLIANCHLPDHMNGEYGGPGVRWQVQWGKHTPVDDEEFRLTHRAYEDTHYMAEYTLPIVMVRDPYKWMQSMCRHRYESHWEDDPDDEKHCPNLVYSQPEGKRHKTFPIEINYAGFHRWHDSLVEFWNDWYQGYLNAKFPFMLVRFEDLIYHPRTVVKHACECAGGKLRKKFRYIVDSAKRGKGAHGAQTQRTSYLVALSRYGTREGRYKGFLPGDLEYTAANLNRTIMDLLDYPFHEDSYKDAGK